MKEPIRATHNGRKFTLLSTGYFLDNSKKPRERLLHRILWIEAFGPIPKGLDVHHKDENKLNNSISNFELKPRSQHRRDHMIQLLERDPGLRQWLNTKLVKARKTCHNWIRSEAGKEWSRAHINQLRQTTRAYVCVHCGASFQASVIGRHKYCSQKCRGRFAYEVRKAKVAAASKAAERDIAALTNGGYGAANEFAAYADA